MRDEPRKPVRERGAATFETAREVVACAAGQDGERGGGVDGRGHAGREFRGLFAREETCGDFAQRAVAADNGDGAIAFIERHARARLRVAYVPRLVRVE